MAFDQSILFFSMSLKSNRFNRSTRLEAERWKTALGKKVIFLYEKKRGLTSFVYYVLDNRYIVKI